MKCQCANGRSTGYSSCCCQCPCCCVFLDVVVVANVAAVNVVAMDAAVALAAARGVCEPVRDIYKCYFTPCSCRRTTRFCVAAAPPAVVVALVCSLPCFADTAFFCVEQRWAISCQGPWGERALVKEPSWQPLGLWGCGSGGLLAKALAGPRNLRVTVSRVSSDASMSAPGPF